MHELGNAVPLIIVVATIAGALWKRFNAAATRRAAEIASAQPRSQAKAPPAPILERPRTPVRRPSPFPSVNAPPAPAPAPARAKAVVPTPAPALAADAFPVLDLSLPGTTLTAMSAPTPRSRRRAGLAGSPGWGASGIVALEILGPPVSLRPGATLGAPHAF